MPLMPVRPGTWAIVRTTLAQAPADSRQAVSWLFMGSVVMLALQAWDRTLWQPARIRKWLIAATVGLVAAGTIWMLWKPARPLGTA